MRRALFASAALASASALFPACRPDFGERASLVDRSVVLAVRGEPPEARPDEAVTYTLLVATPQGTLPSPPASWAHCATPKLLGENGAVSPACLRDGVRPIGDAPGAVVTAVPKDACALFGPETPPGDFRPRDPDPSGGYYQPVRATVAAPGGPLVAFGFERVVCNLANASGEAAAELRARYALNRNPRLSPLEAREGGAPVALEAIPRGATIVLRASWPPEDAEAYVSFDVASQRVVERRESMRVSWFVTAGSLESDRTGRAEGELEAFTDNAWTAPDEPGTVRLWTVLRDARGGVDFAEHTLVVR